METMALRNDGQSWSSPSSQTEGIYGTGTEETAYSTNVVEGFPDANPAQVGQSPFDVTLDGNHFTNYREALSYLSTQKDAILLDRGALSNLLNQGPDWVPGMGSLEEKYKLAEKQQVLEEALGNEDMQAAATAMTEVHATQSQIKAAQEARVEGAAAITASTLGALSSIPIPDLNVALGVAGTTSYVSIKAWEENTNGDGELYSGKQMAGDALKGAGFTAAGHMAGKGGALLVKAASPASKPPIANLSAGSSGGSGFTMPNAGLYG